MTSNPKRVASLALAALVVAGFVAGGALATAPPDFDVETTDTASTTDISSGGTQTYNESTTSYVQFNSTSNATALDVYQGSGADRRLLNEWDNDSMTFVGSAASVYYWNKSLADDGSDYPGLEADAGESVTLEAMAINDTGATNPATVNHSWTFSVGANTSFINYNDSETATAEASSFQLATLNPFANESDAGAANVEQDIGVNGADQDTIEIHIANADAQDSMAEVYDLSDESDTVTYMATAEIDGEFVPVMAAGADAPDWVDTSEDAYITVSETGESATVHNAGAVLSDSDTTATVDITANEAMNAGQAVDMFESYDRDNPFIAGYLATQDFNGEPEFEEVA